jgi:capsular polysaccharide biosynthesis protein
MQTSMALRSMAKGWYFVVLGLLAAVGAAVYLEATAVPVYDSSATYIISPKLDDPAISVEESVKTLDDARSRAIVSTYAEILSSESVHREASAGLGLDVTALADYDFNAAVLPEANVVELMVRGPDPQTTTRLSAAVGDLASERFTDLYLIYDVGLLDPAVAPTSPSNPTLVQTIAMACGLGLLAGAAVALLFGAPRVRREDRMRRRLTAYADSGGSVVTPLHRGEEHRASGVG